MRGITLLIIWIKLSPECFYLTNLTIGLETWSFHKIYSSASTDLEDFSLQPLSTTLDLECFYLGDLLLKNLLHSCSSGTLAGWFNSTLLAQMPLQIDWFKSALPWKTELQEMHCSKLNCSGLNWTLLHSADLHQTELLQTQEYWSELNWIELNLTLLPVLLFKQPLLPVFSPVNWVYPICDSCHCFYGFLTLSATHLEVIVWD